MIKQYFIFALIFYKEKHFSGKLQIHSRKSIQDNNSPKSLNNIPKNLAELFSKDEEEF